ncbi:MAG: ferredoxin [Oscillospiraceae bacterium]|nr:ferredoxin [Oscillospiraceae bacterium]
MKAFVNQDLCIGCGMCTVACPDVFELNGDGKAEAFAETTADNRDDAQTAIDGCPVSAIREKE